MYASVLTFSVQLGSGGEKIARSVAQRLGLGYYDREILTRAAQAVGVTPETVAEAERWPGFLGRMLESLGTAASFDGVLLTAPSVPSLTLTSDDYRRLIERVVVELAQRGNCAIVGHASQVILRDRADAFRVLLWGTEPARANRLHRETNESDEVARRNVEESDARRQDFFKHVYGVDWLDTKLYNLALKTDEIEEDRAVTAILSFFR